MKKKIVITIEEYDEENELKGEKSMDDSRESVSEYARFFDESCPAWNKSSEYNLMFLKLQQQYANDKLKKQGYLFLNEVYDLLGIPRSRAGAVVGWVYDKDNPIGENSVDFDLFADRNHNFINGYERKVLLDFNVDGCIFDKLP